MSLERAFERLLQSCHELNSALAAMRTTVVEDRPRGRDVPLLVERLGYIIDDLLSQTNEACNCAAMASKAIKDRRDADTAREYLVAHQRRFNELLPGILRLTGDDVRQRHRLRKRSEQWKEWMKAMEQSLAAVQPALCTCSSALSECWEELSDRLQSSTVQAHATVNGQQIVNRAESGGTPGLWESRHD